MTSGVAGLWAAMAMFPVSADGPPLELTCRVSGAERIVPALTPDQICDRLARQMSEVMKRPVRTAGIDRAPDAAQSIRVDLRIEPRRGAIAVVEAQRDGKWFKSPELSVTAMDSPLNSTTIEQLGRDIADYLGYE